MAMTACKECGKDVSDAAATCPHCGIISPGIAAKQLTKRESSAVKGFVGLLANARKVSQSTSGTGQTAGDGLLLTPELSLCSYPPEDLLLRDGFYQACAQALAELVHKTSRVSLWWSDTRMNCM